MIIKVGILTFSLFCSVACMKSSSDSMPIKKATGPSGGQQKVDEKASQAALKDQVLVTLENKSFQVTAANLKAVAVMAQLKVNAKVPLVWKMTHKLELGKDLQESAPQVLPSSHDLGDEKLGMSVTAQRVLKTEKADDLGYLVLKFQLGRVADDQDKTVKSYLLVLLDANKVKNPSAILASEVIFPIPKDFKLADWIAKKIAKP